MVPTTHRRHLLRPSLLVLVLAIGTVAGAVVRDATPVAAPADQVALAVPTGAVLSADSTSASVTPGATLPDAASPDIARRPVTTETATAPATRPTPRLPKGIAVTESTVARSAPTSTPTPSPTTHSGRNHVWMAALGIDRSVAGYACSNQAYPGDRVYRWGCAGSNNIYLFGHASSVFRPLHDAYVLGKLKKGMTLYYADDSGTVHRYTVSWWKLTTATKGTWAYAAQSTPSLTLQTCIGSASQYRLIVRLDRTD